MLIDIGEPELGRRIVFVREALEDLARLRVIGGVQRGDAVGQSALAGRTGIVEPAEADRGAEDDQDRPGQQRHPPARRWKLDWLHDVAPHPLTAEGRRRYVTNGKRT